jgi:hypothetical protein
MDPAKIIGELSATWTLDPENGVPGMYPCGGERLAHLRERHSTEPSRELIAIHRDLNGFNRRLSTSVHRLAR